MTRIDLKLLVETLIQTTRSLADHLVAAGEETSDPHLLSAAHWAAMSSSCLSGTAREAKYAATPMQIEGMLDDDPGRGDRMAQAVEALLRPDVEPRTLIFLRQIGDPELDGMIDRMGLE